MKKLLYILTIILLTSCGTKRDLEIAKNQVKYATEMEALKAMETSILYDDVQENETIFDENVPIRETDMVILMDRTEMQIKKESIATKNIEASKEKVIIKESYKTIEKSPNDDIGTITYNVADTMKVGLTYKVSLRITRKGYSEALIEGINRNNNVESTTTVSNIQTSDVMEAVLVGTEEDFIIDDSQSSIRQKIDGQYNEWIWVVTPNKKGLNNLRLVVKIVYVNDGGFVKDLTVFEKDIYTEPNIKKAIIDSLPVFDWNWMWSTIILPIFLYFWNKRKKKKKEESTK